MENIKMSIEYVNTINKIDNLVFKLLYDSQEGYTILKSNEAISNLQNFLDKFEIEADKIVKNSEFTELVDLINQKREYFLQKIKIHYNKELFNYANDVYDSAVDNLLLFVSTNKDNSKFLAEIKNRLINCADWLCEICSYDDKNRASIIFNLNRRFENALNSKDSDFINEDKVVKSDSSLFLEIRNLILNNETDFQKIDFNNLKFKLSIEDINYFNQCLIKLKSNRTTNLKDEILLINSALEIMKLKNDDLKYDFIHQIMSDFLQNKPINDIDKIKIVKRRMKLFNSKNDSDYYKKLLTSSF